MKTILTVISLHLCATALAANPQLELKDGIYSFKVVAHKQGREEPYDDPPVDCVLKMTGNIFTLTPTTNMEWTATGSVSNEVVRLSINRDNMENWIKRGFRFEYIGTITNPNHVEGTHQGFAGTNMYISGTWNLKKKSIQQEAGPYGSPEAGSPSGQP